MNSAQLHHTARVHRVFACACVGDALGAATEGMHPDDIVSVFGGRVTSFQCPLPARPSPPVSRRDA